MKKYLASLLTFLLFINLSLADINVGVVERTKSITANYTALITDDNIFADATSGNVTVTLPSAANKKGKVIKVFKTDSGSNTVTVSGNTISLAGVVTFVSNGTTWMKQGIVSGTTTSPNPTTYSATIADAAGATTYCTHSACSVYNSNGNWINLVTRSDVGKYAITFVTGTFSATPVCSTTPILNSSGASMFIVTQWGVTSTGVNIITFHYDASNVDRLFTISCQGPR